MNYEFTSDGTNFAVSVQNVDAKLAYAILDLIRASEAGLVPDTPYQQVTYRYEAERALRMHSGNIINGIKEMRTRTGLGLKEAKDCCDFAYGRTPTKPDYYEDVVKG